jgi:hypothetical protein
LPILIDLISRLHLHNISNFSRTNLASSRWFSDSEPRDMNLVIRRFDRILGLPKFEGIRAWRSTLVAVTWL